MLVRLPLVEVRGAQQRAACVGLTDSADIVSPITPSYHCVSRNKAHKSLKQQQQLQQPQNALYRTTQQNVLDTQNVKTNNKSVLYSKTQKQNNVQRMLSTGPECLGGGEGGEEEVCFAGKSFCQRSGDGV